MGDLLELAQKSHKQAKAMLVDMYAMLVASKEVVMSKAPEYLAVVKAFVEEQANKLLALTQTTRDLAQEKLTELYTWVLSLSPAMKEQLEQLPAQLKALAVKAPVAVEEKFPKLVAKLRETKQLALDKWVEVKPTLKAKGPEMAKDAVVALPAKVRKLGENAKEKVTA